MISPALRDGLMNLMNLCSRVRLFFASNAAVRECQVVKEYRFAGLRTARIRGVGFSGEQKQQRHKKKARVDLTGLNYNAWNSEDPD
jgi:hypothetical protein